ncbi:MAG: alpha/beta hydrolase [Verrucomicrobia bacterium]|jgi:acetyl esterase/lipase|nr:alpha/beta hydrolase [Verrucomicrobiota bacterium]
MTILWHWMKRIAKGLSLFLMALLLFSADQWVFYHPKVKRTDGVIYGQRHGEGLTLDIIRPKSGSNGLGIALMVSGGWKSGEPGSTQVWMMAPLLRRGYTVFAISHVSQPDATVMEIIEDMHKGIRHVRFNADKYEIDPERIGVTGGSAGGHLSLMLATTGEVGSINSPDPMNRVSSSVQAVAIFYPVTDLLNLGSSRENPGDGGPPKSYVEAFGPDSTNMDKWKEIGRQCSPIYHIQKDLPPTLIYHGDADTLTPLDQSERYVELARKQGNEIELKIHPGGDHGWLTMILDIHDFGVWFDLHL